MGGGGLHRLLRRARSCAGPACRPTPSTSTSCRTSSSRCRCGRDAPCSRWTWRRSTPGSSSTAPTRTAPTPASTTTRRARPSPSCSMPRSARRAAAPRRSTRRCAWPTSATPAPRGYTPEQFQQTMSEAAGIDLSARGSPRSSAAPRSSTSARRSTSTACASRPVDLTAARATMGASTRNDSGRLVVTVVRRGTPAHTAGLNVDDEILAIDDLRVRADGLVARMDQYQRGRHHPPARRASRSPGHVRRRPSRPSPGGHGVFSRSPPPIASRSRVLLRGWVPGPTRPQKEVRRARRPRTPHARLPDHVRRLNPLHECDPFTTRGAEVPRVRCEKCKPPAKSALPCTNARKSLTGVTLMAVAAEPPRRFA